MIGTRLIYLLIVLVLQISLILGDTDHESASDNDVIHEISGESTTETTTPERVPPDAITEETILKPDSNNTIEVTTPEDDREPMEGSGTTKPLFPLDKTTKARSPGTDKTDLTDDPHFAGKIVGIVIGIMLLTLLLMLGVTAIMKSRKRARETKANTPAPPPEFDNPVKFEQDTTV